MLLVRLIEIPSWGPVSLIEASWLAIGLVAMAFALAGLPGDVRLWQASVRRGDRLDELIAWGYVRREGLRVAQASAVAGIGIYACLAGQPAPGPVRTTWVGLILTLALLLVGFVIVLQSAFDRRQQVMIRAEIDTQRKEGS